MKKKVLFLGNHGFVIYNFRKELIQKLLSENYEVFLSFPYDDKVPEMVKWGCKFIDTKVDRRGKNPFKDFKLLVVYLGILLKIRPNVVLTFTIKPNLYGSLACRILHIPCLNNITGLGSGFGNGGFLKFFLIFMYRICLKRSSCVFFQNQQDMNLLIEKKIVKKNYQLIPGSGVNLSEFTLKDFPKETEKIVFIFIGRIMKDKGIDHFLEASKIITSKYPNVIFHIVGFVEPTQSFYEKIIKEYEKKGYIKYFGYQKNVKPFIEDAECIIQPSYSEGLSNVLLESAATGRVLIASDIPGCRETIEQGVNGFTFKVKSTTNLTGILEKYIQLPYKKRKQMGLNSREKVKRDFDRNIVINAYMEEIVKH
ncbi:glycosyl transferase [Weizmannia acidilactici]|uniref:glycosyltransferase family 4 protein n=1 Tax=Heyndrickxia TaxID=2837504 RepID=UPI0002110279|nr:MULTISPECIES: glycosyltransferase family 4 protein [Heyndrickxia]AEH52403.1 glycosyl transferase group 1 [Heyndrickxia coagulans 2-6]GER67961.1 glycosyl transferase [Weizmannia acidilactici]